MEKNHAQAAVAKHPLSWIPEFFTLTDRRIRGQARLLGTSIMVGIGTGLAGVVFVLAVQIVMYFALWVGVGYESAKPSNEHPPRWLENPPAWFPQPRQGIEPWLLLIIPTIGGVLCGALIFSFAPEAEGHGTDAVIAAYHDRKGFIRYRVPIVKTIASALTIGTGGSGGPEGPITQIGGGLGCFFANLFRLTSPQRRVLMAAGMGAGIAAILRAPLAGALFASEVLYWSSEFEPEVLMPAGLASVASYCTLGCFIEGGFRPLFSTPSYIVFENPLQLGPYTLLAVCMILLAAVYTRSFYGFTRLFHRLQVPRWLKPAVGAFLMGAVALAIYFGFRIFGYGNEYVLSVLSFGYGSLQEALNGQLQQHMNNQALTAAAVLTAVALGKILTTGLTIGSGGSGGVFSPSIVIGGCAGAALGLVLKVVLGGLGFPEVAPEPAAFALVGMAGFFAAAAKTPFSILVIVSEMTGNYELILPCCFVCTIAFLFSDRQSLYQSQVMSRSLSPAHQGTYVREVLAGLQVRLFLDPHWDGPVLHPEERVDCVSDRFTGADHDVLPVVDSERRYVGVVSLEEMYAAAQATNAGPMLLTADLMRTDITPLHPDDGLDRAMEIFAESDLLALPVVDESQGKRVVGVVKRHDVAGDYLRRLHEPKSMILTRAAQAKR